MFNLRVWNPVVELTLTYTGNDILTGLTYTGKTFSISSHDNYSGFDVLCCDMARNCIAKITKMTIYNPL
jgi:hypothetical protein